MNIEKNLNKDLILREKLALQRTALSNQTTFLAYIRTSLYFVVAALSIQNLLRIENGWYLELGFFVASGIILGLGLISYFHHRKRIEESKRHIGHYQDEFLDKAQ
ncbi:MAG TPA: DUF202 domain-containing protein [Saprospiraceae bacterium]|nr:DUF202 domain-containing protein [Saprospiraceae bacterium]HNT22047.1 DUF202 domain-containing protein [Saprospiraceae bacterium]